MSVESCSQEGVEEEEGCDVSVVEVYELAAAIGKECEQLIERHGGAAVAGLVPKLVGALELLEAVAQRNDLHRDTRRQLAERVHHLEHDKRERQHYRQRFEKELEAIEDQWRAESADLVAAIRKLQDENKRLTIKHSHTTPTTPTSEEADILQRFNDTNERQRSALREKDTLIEDKDTIIDGLTDQVKRLATSNREARRKQKYLLQQVRMLCTQRAQLEANVQARQREISTLREALSNEQNGSGNGAQLAELLRERDQLKEELDNLRRDSSGSDQPSSLELMKNYQPEGNLEDDEPPVQGPLPFEPDDAPWKRQQSGIRKFFRKLFSEYDVSVGSFSGRTFTTFTTKMGSASRQFVDK